METNEIRILKQDFDNYKSLDVGYHDISQIRDIKMTLTIPLESFPHVRFDVKFRKKNLPDYMVCGVAYIVSKRLKDLFEEFKVKAEFFPVEIYFINEQRFIGDYYYFHLLAEEDCFDFENSEYEVDEDDDSVESIERLELAFKSALSNDIFFIAEIDYRIICLTKTVCEAIVKNKITGIRLAEPSELKW
jgi:hypothetical protein